MFWHIVYHYIPLDTMTKPIKKRKDNPTPIRLGQLKCYLQKEAMEQDRSLHWLVVKILSAYVQGKKGG